jgi:hypothetical protein
MRTLLLLLALASTAAALPADTRAQAQTTQRYNVDDAVSIQWSASWWPGRILAVEGERYRVRYDGYDASWDEWVSADRLRRPDAPAAAPASPAVAPTPPAPAPAPAPDAAATGVHGTWQYRSWVGNQRGQPRGEILNADVFYWLTLRPNGRWTLSNTTRWSPNTSETVAWGTYTLRRGELVLTQGGTPARTYGRYTVQQEGAEMTLRETSTGDVIRLRRGRG